MLCIKAKHLQLWHTFIFREMLIGTRDVKKIHTRGYLRIKPATSRK